MAEALRGWSHPRALILFLFSPLKTMCSSHTRIWVFLNHTVPLSLCSSYFLFGMPLLQFSTYHKPCPSGSVSNDISSMASSLTSLLLIASFSFTPHSSLWHSDLSSLYQGCLPDLPCHSHYLTACLGQGSRHHFAGSSVQGFSQGCS